MGLLMSMIEFNKLATLKEIAEHPANDTLVIVNHDTEMFTYLALIEKGYEVVFESTILSEGGERRSAQYLIEAADQNKLESVVAVPDDELLAFTRPYEEPSLLSNIRSTISSWF